MKMNLKNLYVLARILKYTLLMYNTSSFFIPKYTSSLIYFGASCMYSEYCKRCRKKEDYEKLLKKVNEEIEKIEQKEQMEDCKENKTKK